MKKLIAIALLIPTLALAAGVKDLEPGMTMEQVTTMLGEPSEKEFAEGGYILTYTEFKMGKGRVPYLLGFDTEKVLRVIQIDQAGLSANQARVMGMAGYLQNQSAINALRAARNDTLTIKQR